jgi:parallel beta-helix repeat protein
MRRHLAGWAGALCRPLFRSKTSRGRRRPAEPLRRRPADFISSLGFIEGLESRAMLAINISLIGSELTIYFQGASAEFAEVGRLDATTYQVTDSDGDTLTFNVADVESILAYGEASTEHRLTITELSAEPITAGLIVNPTVRLTEIKAAFAIPTRPAGKGGVFVDSPEILLTNDITTTNADVNFAFLSGGALTLDGDISIDTGAGDGNITFGTTVDVLSTAPGATLTLATGAGGVVFDAAVGGTKPLQGIAVLSGSGVVVGATATISLDGTAPGFTPFADGLAIAAGVNNAQFTAGGSIANFTGAGVFFAGPSTNSTISGFAIGGNGQGVTVTGGATPDFIGTQIVDNVIGGLTTPNGVGIELLDVATAPGAGLLIAANQVTANTGRGIVAQGSTNHRIIGNIVNGNGAEGMAILDGSHGIGVLSNQVQGNGKSDAMAPGILVRNSSSPTGPVKIGAGDDFTVVAGGTVLTIAGDLTQTILVGQQIGIRPTTPAAAAAVLRTVTGVTSGGGTTAVTISAPIDGTTTAGQVSFGNIVSGNPADGIVASGLLATDQVLALEIVGNAVHGNGGAGIRLSNATGTLGNFSGTMVYGNLVGIDAVGAADGNAGDGISLSAADVTEIGDSVVGHNKGHGVVALGGGRFTIVNNSIGVDSGIGAAANGGTGVLVGGGGGVNYGGSNISENRISNNLAWGVEVLGVAAGSMAEGILISGNEVNTNQMGGIVFVGSPHNRVIGNLVGDSGAGAMDTAPGIAVIDGSHGTLAYSNAVSGSTGTGIFVKDSSTLGAPVQVGAALDFGVGGIPTQLILAGDQTGLIFAGQTIGLVASPAGTVPPELRTVTAVDFDSGVTVVTIDVPTALTSGLMSLGNIVSTNGLAGIVLSTGGGGASTAARITGNLVTDSKSQGIALLNDPGNAATALSGAEVFLNLVGGAGAGNGADGVLVSWADGTVIDTNQIEANGLNGINLVNAGAGPEGTTVENNTIAGHGFSGIQVFADKAGSYAGAILGNYSHANAGNGLVFYQTAVVPATFPVEVRGNVIGVTPTGTPAGNTLHGIQLNPANYGGAVIAGNRVEFNSLWGLYLNATSSAPVADAQIGQLGPFEVVSPTVIRVPLDRTDWFHPPWQIIGLLPPSLGSVTPSLPGLVRTVVGDYYDSGDDHTYVTLDAPIDGVEPGWSLSLGNTLRQNSGYGLVVNGAVTGTSVVGNLITLNSSVGAFLNEATGLELTANGIADNPFAGLFAAGDLSDTVAFQNWIGRSSGITTQSVGVQLLGAQGLSLDMNAVVNNVVNAVVASGTSTGTKLTGNVVSGSAMGLVLDAATGLGVGQAAAGNQFGRPVPFTSSLQGTSLVVSGDERLGFEVGSVVAIRPAGDPESGMLRIIQSVSYTAGNDTTTIVIDGAYDNASTAGELLARNWIAGVYGQGTLTGTALEGNSIEGNTYGIYLTNSANGLRTGATTGEDVPDATGNVVAYNAIHGALVIGVGSLGNPFVSNAFYLNGQQGIFLFDGGNGNLPRPVLAAATRIGGVVRVSGTLSAPEGIYRLQFFRNVAGDVPAPLDVFGFEGRQLVQAGGGSGFLEVAVGPSGTASFLAEVPGTAVVNGEWITSTTSSLLAGLPFNTSFFSPGVQVV